MVFNARLVVSHATSRNTYCVPPLLVFGEPDMNQLFATALLWFAAIGCGLLAGLYFAFSTFIMSALGRIQQVHGVSAMNSINSTILHSLFMPFFFGTTLASLLLF